MMREKTTNEPARAVSLRIWVTLVSLVAASFAPQLHAAVFTLNFEDGVSDSGDPIVPTFDPYHGLHWIGIGTLNGSLFYTNQTGYVFGAVDGPHTAYNLNGQSTSITSADGTPFAYESGTWSASRESFDLTIKGYLNGNLQFETTQTIFEETPTIISAAAFSSKAIDKLELTSNGGGLQWALDHFQFSSPAPVPEPATLAYLTAGLMLLAGIARRRR